MIRLLAWFIPATAAMAAAPELRAVWAARDSLGSREQIRQMMRNLDRGNFNAVFVNVWSRGYTLYPSEVFERASGLSIDPAFAGRDVLRESMEEAAPFGIAVIPWLEYGFAAGWSGALNGTSCGPVFERHPQWLARNRAGEARFPLEGGGFFCWIAHTHPEGQEFLISLMEEIARKYDVPAIEFDRARYPSLDCGYDEATLALYAASHDGAKPPQQINDPAWMRWRANHLNAFVKRLHDRTKAANWRVLITNAPVVFPFSYSNFLQEYPAWIAQGSLDFVSPQIYRSNANLYVRELDAQLSRAGKTERLVPGIDISNSRNVEDLAEQIRVTRERQLPGFAVWYYQSLNAISAFEKLQELVLQDKAPLPWR
jgi:uncharacterized lipoprotein YddW (UPF0748 family)